MSVAKLIRILLVDDDVLVRQAVRSALQVYSNIEVVGEQPFWERHNSNQPSS